LELSREKNHTFITIFGKVGFLMNSP